MASKELESIIANLPPAMVHELGSKDNEEINEEHLKPQKENMSRIVAVVSDSVKKEIREKSKQLKVPETVIIPMALKKIGFNSIKDSMLIDKCKLR
jgi:hypothetical protein